MIERIFRGGKWVILPSHQSAKAFKTYVAIAKTLAVGEKAIVRVVCLESKVNSWCFGYGEVIRTPEGYITPNILTMEY